MTCEELKMSLLDCLKDFDLDTRQFRIGIPDREIESWILADPSTLALTANIRANAYRSMEGASSKGFLQKLMGEELKYHESTIGVDFFCNCDPKVIYQESVSFRDFADEIKDDCQWVSGV